MKMLMLVLALAVAAPAHAINVCQKGSKVKLRTTPCKSRETFVQDLAQPGPPGPAGPRGPQGPAAALRLAYVDASVTLAPGEVECAAAECAAGDRILECGTLNTNGNTPLISAVGLRDPEDDVEDDLLGADTCIACWANDNVFTTVSALARATCIVGGK